MGMFVKTKMGNDIEIRRSWGRKTLYLNGHPQSGSWYRSVWYKLLRKRVGENKRILILGLGGGDLVKVIHKISNRNHIDIVEIEPEMVGVSREYFGLRNESWINIHIMDAKIYLQNNTSKYDLVIVDLYEGDNIPKFVEGKRFLLNLKMSLSNDGVVIINYASHSFDQNDFDKFGRKLHKYFLYVQKLKIWGHTYFVAKDS